MGAYHVDSRALGDSQDFADALFASDYLQGVPEFLLIHHRPGAVPKAGQLDLDRVRVVILAGRLERTELLDCLIVGEPEKMHPSGVFSFRRIRGFSALHPFNHAELQPERKDK